MSNGTFGELKWAAGAPIDAIKAYEAAVTFPPESSGPALEQSVRSRMDLDLYLEWLALLSLLGSGDFVDEVFFQGTTTTDSSGKPAQYFQMTAWDQDDLYTRCHHDNYFAVDDPYGLLTCAEAEADHRIGADPHLYRRYVDTLAAVIARYPTARFRALVEATSAKLLEYFAEPRILAGMVELRRIDRQGTFTADGARSLMNAEVAALVELYDVHQRRLLDRIAGYRAGRPLPRPDAGVPPSDAGVPPSADAGMAPPVDAAQIRD